MRSTDTPRQALTPALLRHSAPTLSSQWLTLRKIKHSANDLILFTTQRRKFDGLQLKSGAVLHPSDPNRADPIEQSFGCICMIERYIKILVNSSFVLNPKLLHFANI